MPEMLKCYRPIAYTVSQKQDTLTLLMSITSQNIDRFSKLFHC